MSPLHLDLIMLAIAVLVVAGLITLIMATQRARYARFRKRYERLHPLTTRANTMSSRMVDSLLAKENKLENDRILASIPLERTYSMYASNLVVGGLFWLLFAVISYALVGYPSPVLALLIILTPLPTLFLGRVLFRSSLRAKAEQVRKLIGPSLPNLLSLLKLEIAESTDPVTAFESVVNAYSAFIAPQGLALLQSWLAMAQNQELGSVLVTEGERFDLKEIVTLGKAFERGSRGMSLTLVLEKQIAATSELSQYDLLRRIRGRVNGMALLFFPAMVSMLVITMVSLAAIGGGVHGLTQFL
ncbi:MAG: hypothetical protein ACYCTG_05435 [Ferrimicrobium sp.]